MPDVLLFIEDPGAANFVSGVPSALVARGRAVELAAAGSAVAYFAARGVDARVIEPGTAPEALIASAAPGALGVGTSENLDSLGLALVDAARATGVPSVGLVDAAANAEFRFRGRSAAALAHAPDRLLVPDADTAAGYVALGYDAERVTAVGHPHHDAVRAKAAELAARDRDAMRRELFPGLADGRPVVVFVAEISTGLDPAQFLRSDDYTLTGTRGSDGRTEIVIEELLNATAAHDPAPYLVLRLHPKHMPAEYADYEHGFALFSRDEPPLELIYAADAVVGMTSSLLIEAAVMGQRTLALVPRALELAWLPSSVPIPGATTRDELASGLAALLRPPFEPPRPAAAYAGPPAAERIAEFFDELLRAVGFQGPR